MNLLECTKVNTFFEFTKQNEKIFKKKLFIFVNAPIFTLQDQRRHPLRWEPLHPLSNKFTHVIVMNYP